MLFRSTAPAPSAPVATSALPTTVDDGTGNLDRVLNQIVEEGGLLDERNSALLRDAVIKLAEDKARNVVNAQSVEESKWNDVSQRMELNYPGSSNRADELHIYVQSNPSVSTAVAALLAQGKEYEATELAWRLMTSSSPGQPPCRRRSRSPRAGRLRGRPRGPGGCTRWTWDQSPSAWPPRRRRPPGRRWPRT